METTRGSLIYSTWVLQYGICLFMLVDDSHKSEGEGMMPLVEDAYFLVYQSFFVLGIGTLFPWNALITANNYFLKRFCGSDYEENFENDIALVYMLSNLVTLCIVVRYQNLLNRRLRILGSFGVWFVLFAITTIIVVFKDVSAGPVYWLTVTTCFLCGIFSATCSGGVFSMVAQFPGSYMGAVMSGQGLSGLTAALVGMGVALVNDATGDDDDCDDDDVNVDSTDNDDSSCSKYDSVDWGSFSYFMVACLIFILCIASYVFLENSRFAQYYDRASQAYSAVESNDTRHIFEPDANTLRQSKLLAADHTGHIREQQNSNTGDNGADDADNENQSRSGVNLRNGIVESPLVASVSANEGVLNGTHATEIGRRSDEGAFDSNRSQPPLRKATAPALADYKRILWRVRADAFSVWAVFAVTISIFPGVTTLIRPRHSKGCGKHAGPFTDATFTALLFVIFNLMDLVGRTAAGFVQIIPRKLLPVFAIARVCFVPLFLLCNIRDSNLDVHSKPVFDSDLYPIIFMVTMALSNGYLSTLAMIYGPQQINPQSSDGEIAGAVMILSLTFGLASGTLLAYANTAIAV